MLFLLLAALVLAGCSAQSENADAGVNAEINTLTFSAAELTQEPAFVDWNQDGTAMQLIARKDENGAVWPAFNTCQSCGGSPYAWFEYLGNNNLQCQNCGLTFALATVGTTNAEIHPDALSFVPYSQEARKFFLPSLSVYFEFQIC